MRELAKIVEVYNGQRLKKTRYRFAAACGILQFYNDTTKSEQSHNNIAFSDEVTFHFSSR